MNKKAMTEDLMELVFTMIVLVIIVLVSFLFQAANKQSILEAARNYDSDLDISYSLNNLLRTPVKINDQEATIAEFIALSVEEDSFFIKDLFGLSLKSDVNKKIRELMDPLSLPISIESDYNGETYLWFYSTLYSPQGVNYEINSDTIQIPSLKEGSIDIIVKRSVLT